MLIVPVLSQRWHLIFHSEDPSQIKSSFQPFFLRDWSQLLTKLCKWKGRQSEAWVGSVTRNKCFWLLVRARLAESRAGLTKENPTCWSTGSPCSRCSPDSTPGCEAPLFLCTSCSLTDSSSSPWLQDFWWIVFRASPICLMLLSQLDLFVSIPLHPNPPSSAEWGLGSLSGSSLPSPPPCSVKRGTGCGFPSSADTGGDWHSALDVQSK